MESRCKVCGRDHATGACTEKPKYIVGAAQRADGTFDVSKAATWDGNTNYDSTVALVPEKEKPALTPAERQQFLARLQMESYRGKDRMIRHKAKEKGVEPSVILAEIRSFAKGRIDSPERVFHYHQTSFENFKRIIEAGGLLSRSEIKKRNPDANPPAWSASDDVMMTRDIFDKNGDLINKGLTPHGVGASGKGVVLVMGPKMMELGSYDATLQYPTISDAPLDGNCVAVLIGSESDRQMAVEMLDAGGVKNISVMTRDAWEKQHYIGDD